LELLSRLQGNMARLSLLILLLGVMGVSLAACGGDEATPTVPAATGGNPAGNAAGNAAGNTAATPATQGGSGSAQEVKATLTEWSVSLNVDQVNAGKVKFVVSNEGQLSHNLTVLDSSSTQVGTTPTFKKADGTKELDVDLKSGTYTVVCSVPGHTEKGMKTTLTVK
jgi:uncharacterized cupredoxin-like copper-binding protein